jgi:hypothetical protein
MILDRYLLSALQPLADGEIGNQGAGALGVFGMGSMSTFKIAHIREQGVDLIIVPMDRAFGRRPKADQQLMIAEMQEQTIAAKLAGTVVPVWDCGGGQMGFMAPPGWHPFFQSINLAWVYAKLNRELHVFAGWAGDQAAVALDLNRVTEV